MNENFSRHRIRCQSVIGAVAIAGALPVSPLPEVAAEDAAASPEPEKISLWQERAPVGEGKFEKADAFITVHRPARPNGTAVVICPGGGYGGVVIDPEGHLIAKWLNRHGIVGVVLQYRLPKGNKHIPLLDAQRTLRVTRSRAKEWGCAPDKIGIMGFSAGGHLASTAATHFDRGDSESADPVARVSCRPDFQILVYPVITMGPRTHGGSRNNLLGPNPTADEIEFFSNEKQVTGQTPPAFLAHAIDDKAVASDHSRIYFEVLKAHKVPAKYLELPSGGHGLNGYQGPMWDAWQTQSLEWLAEQKILPE